MKNSHRAGLCRGRGDEGVVLKPRDNEQACEVTMEATAAGAYQAGINIAIARSPTANIFHENGNTTLLAIWFAKIYRRLDDPDRGHTSRGEERRCASGVLAIGVDPTSRHGGRSTPDR